MTITTTYTFYVEVNNESVTGLTPTISNMISIVDGTEVTTKPTISEISEGFYKFSYDWDDSSLVAGYLLKIDTGANTETGRVITMRIEPQDYLPELTTNLKSSSDSLSTATSTITANVATLDSYVKRLLDIEQGTWKIEGTKLKLYSAGYGLAVDSLIAEYDLFDEQGIATNINPFERRLDTLTNI